MTTDAAYGAVYALIGAVAGAMLALVPISLKSWLDSCNRLRGFVILLEQERTSLGTYSVQIMNTVTSNIETGATIGKRILTAWPAASVDASFMEGLTGNADLAAIIDVYATFGVLSQTIDAYHGYLNAPVKLGNQSLLISDRNKNLLSIFMQLKFALERAAPVYESLLNRYSTRLLWARSCYWLAVFVGLAVVIIASVYVYPLLHRSLGPAQSTSARSCGEVKVRESRFETSHATIRAPTLDPRARGAWLSRL